MKISETGRKNQKAKLGHKHCRSDCVEDNHFVKSLRKYSNLSTTRINKQNKIKDIGGIKSSSVFRPRYITKNAACQMKTKQIDNQNPKGRQIEQLIIKVQIDDKNKVIQNSRDMLPKQKTSIIQNSCNQTAEGYTQDHQKTMPKMNGFEQLKINVERISKIVDRFNSKFRQFDSDVTQKDQKQMTTGQEMLPGSAKSFQQFSTKTPPYNISKQYLPDLHISQFKADSKQREGRELKMSNNGKMRQQEAKENQEVKKARKKFLIEGNKLNYIMFSCLQKSRISQLSLIESRKNI